MSMKNERDLTIQSLLVKHNLGPLTSGPFIDEVAFDLTNRIQSKSKDMDKDLQDKKVPYLCCQTSEF